jgi:hypothetical protein
MKNLLRRNYENLSNTKPCIRRDRIFSGRSFTCYMVPVNFEDYGDKLRVNFGNCTGVQAVQLSYQLQGDWNTYTAQRNNDGTFEINRDYSVRRVSGLQVQVQSNNYYALTCYMTVYPDYENQPSPPPGGDDQENGWTLGTVTYQAAGTNVPTGVRLNLASPQFVTYVTAKKSGNCGGIRIEGLRAASSVPGERFAPTRRVQGDKFVINNGIGGSVAYLEAQINGGMWGQLCQISFVATATPPYLP